MGTTAREPMERDECEEEAEEKPQPARTGAAAGNGMLRRCRMCARTVPSREPAARIFSEEGRRLNLQRHIQKYLCIQVSSGDKLPKMVCGTCVAKLDGIHAFATMALRSQERLKQELLKTCTDSAVIVDSSNSSDNLKDKLGERGLLHSILTKGSTETSNEDEPIQERERTPSTEEMEVKVDPMLFLQCALEQSSSAECSDFSDDSDKEVGSFCSVTSKPLSSVNKPFIEKGKAYSAEANIQRNRDNNDNEDLDIIDDDKDNETDDEAEFEEREDHSSSKPKPHECKICTRAFATQIALQNHLWSHLPTTTSDIRECADNASVLRIQNAIDDSNGLISQNNSCSEGNRDLLSDNFICPICGKKISTKGNLKVHLETHRPKGKYGCDICGRIFKTQSNLFRHKEYHSGIQFPCSVCGRVYPTNSTLRAHSITHSDLRPHACPLCDKTFKRNQDLKFHINQHTGARPYQCPYCPKAFASSGNCFSHRKRMHPKEVHRDRQRAADLMR